MKKIYFVRGIDNLNPFHQLTFTCSKSTMETVEKGVKHFQRQL